MTIERKKTILSYKRDETGHLMCHLCDFKPKATPKHPHGNASTLHYHLKNHTNEFAHVCEICNHGFLQKQVLENHKLARHPELCQKEVEQFRCPYPNCEFQSLTKSNRRIHFLRKHCEKEVEATMETVLTETGKLLRCKCCSTDLKSRTAFYYHVGACMLSHNMDVDPLLATVC